MRDDVELGHFMRAYFERVVNNRDSASVDELVAVDYVGEGFGWPADRASLRAFYERQVTERPDWRIDVQQTVEVDDVVAVRAYAGGTLVNADGTSRRQDLEWLASYRVVDGLVTETRILSLVERVSALG